MELTNEEKIQTALKSISILNKRIISIKDDQQSVCKGLFDDKGCCLYYKMLGDSYHTLIQCKYNDDEYENKCLHSYMSAVSFASAHLDITDRKHYTIYC